MAPPSRWAEPRRPRLFIVQLAATASMALPAVASHAIPGAIGARSGRDRLRRPWTRRPLARDRRLLENGGEQASYDFSVAEEPRTYRRFSKISPVPGTTWATVRHARSPR
jgi:hypothetical protein